MSPELLGSAWEIVVQTVSYLFAYGYVLVLAPLAHVALVALAPGRRGWLDDREGPLVGAVLGLTEPLSRSVFAQNLRRLGTPGGVAAYLGVSHALTVYSWVLLGPLLGKDFLLSHVVGVVLFAFLVTSLIRWAGVPVEMETEAHRTDPPEEGTPTRAVLGLLRFAGLAGLGIVLGGLVAAWGLSPGGRIPAEIGSGGGWTQLANGGLGLVLALLALPPVANLFAGTYLWKIGLAHAGIAAFFCAAPAAPTRWRLYARLYGRRGSARLVGVLLIAALLAGLITAWIFGVLDVSIRYKLIAEQLWVPG